MSDYRDVKFFAEKWNISRKHLQILCKQGKIDGAVKEKGKWYIPSNTARPVDKRIKSGKYIGWREKYHVNEKINPELKQLIDEMYKNAESTKKKDVQVKIVID